MRVALVHHELWDGHGADLVRLRWAADQLAGDRLERLGHVDSPSSAVEATDSESAHLARAQSAVGGEQDEEPVVGPDGVGDAGDLAGVEEGGLDPIRSWQPYASDGVVAHRPCVAGEVGRQAAASAAIDLASDR